MKQLKTILLFTVFSFFLFACSKEEDSQPQSDNSSETDTTADSNKEEVSFGGTVYLTQAKDSDVIIIDIDKDMTKPSETPLSVTIEGSQTAPKDVSIQFAVDKYKVADYNQEGNTAYTLIPKRAYEISPSSAVIPKGETVSGKISIKIISSEIDQGRYLLPVVISTDEGTVDESQSTIYFVINVPIPKIKVLSLGTDWGDILSAGPDGILYLRDEDSVMLVYKPDQNGMYSADPTAFPGSPWKASGWFYCIRDSVEMVVNDDGYYGMFRFDIDPETYFLTGNETVNPSDPWPTNFGFYYSDGWNIYTLLPQNDFIFFWDRNTGELLRAPMDDFLDPHPGTWNKIDVWINGGERDVVSTDFKDYVQVLSYGSSLIAVKSDGTLWAYSVGNNGDLGDARQIGSGWERYVKLIASGQHILALDAKGDVYRYRIDVNEFYDLTI